MAQLPAGISGSDEHSGSAGAVACFLAHLQVETAALRVVVVLPDDRVHKAELHRTSLHVRVAVSGQRGESAQEDQVEIFDAG